jgi:hypothetical protein
MESDSTLPARNHRSSSPELISSSFDDSQSLPWSSTKEIIQPVAKGGRRAGQATTLLSLSQSVEEKWMDESKDSFILPKKIYNEVKEGKMQDKNSTNSLKDHMDENDKNEKISHMKVAISSIKPKFDNMKSNDQNSDSLTDTLVAIDKDIGDIISNTDIGVSDSLEVHTSIQQFNPNNNIVQNGNQKNNLENSSTTNKINKNTKEEIKKSYKDIDDLLDDDDDDDDDEVLPFSYEEMMKSIDVNKSKEFITSSTSDESEFDDFDKKRGAC